MKESQSGSRPRLSDHGASARAVLGALLAIFLLCLVLLPPVAAAKPYVEVGTFGGIAKGGELSEEAQLEGVSALAVNYTGAGGVPKGTVYAVTHANGENNVARFSPEGSGLKFVERWGVMSPRDEKFREEHGVAPYPICGPAVAVPGEGLTGSPNCAMSAAGSQGGLGIAVNQTTGYVYVAEETGVNPVGTTLIHVYTPNGSAVVARFGEQGPTGSGQGKLEAETPSQIHSSTDPGTLAVNADGEVFVFDLESNNKFFHRLMVFKPKEPGNYSAYEYAGQSADIGAGFLGETNYPTQPVVDDDGYVYVATSLHVEKYDPATPDAPVCTYSFPPGGITAMTVNPATGEPFFYSNATKPRRIRELSACENGEFKLTNETEVAPFRETLFALAFDPVRQLSAGREPGVLYGAAPQGPALGYIFAQPEENPAVIGDVAPTNVTSRSATLTAVIDPRGFVTHYAFHYLTQSQYEAQGETFSGALEAPMGGADLAPASGTQRVEASVTGLEPATTYVFQVVASSNCSPAEPTKVCPVESIAAALHTYAIKAPGPADGRAYELVSPVDKQGGQVLPANPSRKSCAVACKPGLVATRFPSQSTSDGSKVVFEGEPFGSGGALIENEYLSRRTAAGWQTTTLAPSQLQNRDGNGYNAFDLSLTAGVLTQGTPALTGSTPGEYRNLYRQSTSEPESLTSILTSANASPTCSPGSGLGSLKVIYAGGSTDLSRVFFEANDALTAESAGSCGQSNLYESVAGGLRAVNVLPGDGVSSPGAVFGSGQLLESGNPNNPSRVVTHAISDDGSRAFFTGADGHLYVRIDGATTLEVPGPGNCSAATPLAQRVCFLTASADGSSVVISNGQVYAENETGSAYEPSIDLAQGQGGFQGIAGQSEDLSHLYFVDTANLTGGEENDQGGVAEAGENNLYSSVDGSTHFIATLGTKDVTLEREDWVAATAVRTAKASPAGRWLAFQSEASLTGYENSEKQEVFLYDSQTQALECASCNPSGSRPVGDSLLPTYAGAGGYLPQAPYLTDSGRLLFDSGDRLVPADTNGTVEDLYEYEPQGVGDCSEPNSCLNLISSGRGASDSNFLTMDETGDNIFFTTRSRLVGADKDELIDLYDARVGGGFPEPQPPVECEGEACQQASGSPGQPAPSSMNLPSENSSTPARRHGCKKGKVKRSGRCVKKRKSHKGKKHKKAGARHERKGDN